MYLLLWMNTNSLSNRELREWGFYILFVYFQRCVRLLRNWVMFHKRPWISKLFAWQVVLVWYLNPLWDIRVHQVGSAFVNSNDPACFSLFDISLGGGGYFLTILCPWLLYLLLDLLAARNIIIMRFWVVEIWFWSLVECNVALLLLDLQMILQEILPILLVLAHLGIRNVLKDVMLRGKKMSLLRILAALTRGWPCLEVLQGRKQLRQLRRLKKGGRNTNKRMMLLDVMILIVIHVLLFFLRRLFFNRVCILNFINGGQL